MALGFFCDKSMLPSEIEVSNVLGETAVFWDELKYYLEKFGSIREEWRIYSKNAGWCKKLLLISGNEERNIIFLYPNTDCITGVLVFGENAVKSAADSKIPENILNRIYEAKAYKEGRSFNVEIRNTTDFENLKMLIDIKIQN